MEVRRPRSLRCGEQRARGAVPEPPPPPAPPSPLSHLCVLSVPFVSAISEITAEKGQKELFSFHTCF